MVGSHVQVTWNDKAVWKLLLTEVSDLHHFISYEVVDAEPHLAASSVQATIKLFRVSDENHTFVTWVIY